jgi:chromosome segregation ATPase
MNNPYPELAAVLSASLADLAPRSTSPGMAAAAVLQAAPSISLATAATAVSQAMALLDGQVTAVEQANVVPNFPGAQPMVDALAQMKQAAGQWRGVKGTVVSAALSTVEAGPAASVLGVSSADDAASLAAAILTFVESTLLPLQRQYRAAQGAFDTFSENLAQAESIASDANTDAVQALDTEQAAIQAQINDINAQINQLNSASSIIIAILTGGASIEEQMANLMSEQASLRNTEQAATAQRQAYAMAYSQFTNACSAAALAVRATATLNTALEQAVNALNDVIINTSGNVMVMQAEVSSFRQEFAGAVSASQAMLN